MRLITKDKETTYLYLTKKFYNKNTILKAIEDYKSEGIDIKIKEIEDYYKIIFKITKDIELIINEFYNYVLEYENLLNKINTKVN